MSDDDWTERDLERETSEEKCPKCGAKHKITITIGPDHGGWAEDYELRCKKCGTLIDSGKAFGATIERVGKG